MSKKMFLFIFMISFGLILQQCIIGRTKKTEDEGFSMKSEIIKAVNENNYIKTKELLEKGIDINTKDSKNRTLLMIAVYNNNYKISKLLIDNKADINIQDDMLNNPFLYAGAEGQLEILKLLVKAGADTKITNRYGGVALIPASEHGYVETVKYLLENTDIDINHINNLGWTALLEAIILGTGSSEHTEVVALLLKHGADPNLADGNKVSPLMHAKNRSYNEIIKLLIDAGAK